MRLALSNLFIRIPHLYSQAITDPVLDGIGKNDRCRDRLAVRAVLNKLVELAAIVNGLLDSRMQLGHEALFALNQFRAA
jgi:hypothetical protein